MQDTKPLPASIKIVAGTDYDGRDPPLAVMVDPFEPGDIVRLNSSCVLMTVEDTRGPNVDCVWLNSHAEPMRDSFSWEALVFVEEAE